MVVSSGDRRFQQPGKIVLVFRLSSHLYTGVPREPDDRGEETLDCPRGPTGGGTGGRTPWGAPGHHARLESVPDADPNAVRDTPMVVDELREQVSYLREQLRREQDAHAEARRAIAGLAQRVPELEAAPQEQRDAPRTAEEEPDRASVRRGWVSGGRTEALVEEGECSASRRRKRRPLLGARCGPNHRRSGAPPR